MLAKTRQFAPERIDFVDIIDILALVLLLDKLSIE
jgi:hypothetical protein